MKNRVLLFFIIFLIFSASNCHTRHYRLPPGPSIPPEEKITLYPVSLSMTSGTLYNAANSGGFIIRRVMETEGRFDHIIYWNDKMPFKDYHIKIISRSNSKGSGLHLLLSILTLFTVPYFGDLEIEFDVSIYKHGKLLKFYKFKENFSHFFWLFNVWYGFTDRTLGIQSRLAFEDLARHIIYNIRNDGLIPELPPLKSTTSIAKFTASIFRVYPSTKEIRLTHPAAPTVFKPGQIFIVREKNSAKQIGKVKIRYTSYSYALSDLIEGDAAKITENDTVALVR